tara:strand:+ start:5672 stop:6676 length:1005 start_codon:yes stop_codon:yes gene_type:complete
MTKKINLNGKNVLITGGAGFIGSNIAFYLQEKYPECNITIFDKFRDNNFFHNGNPTSYGHFDNLIGFKGRIICGDICLKNDLALLMDLDFDFIFHQAAISDTRVYDQNIVMRTNVNSFYDLINLAKNKNATLIYASSGAVYGSSISPQTVGMESPENPYGYSKYSMDMIAKESIRSGNFTKIYGLRYFNVYGPGEFYKDKTSSMVIQLGHQILSGKPPGLFTGSEKIFRDFIYIDDIVDANILCISSSSPGIYNIGTGAPKSFQKVLDYLQDHLGKSEVNYFDNPYKEGYQYHTSAEVENTYNELGFKAKFDLKSGIEKYIPYIKAAYKKIIND